VSKVVHPAADEWRNAVRPLHPGRAGVVAWLVAVGTTILAFFADGGWERLNDDLWVGPFEVLDMLDGASAVLLAGFVVLGWVLGRRALIVSPLVLLFVAIMFSYAGRQPAAAVWWFGFALAVIWATMRGVIAIHRLASVRVLAQSSLTDRQIHVGPNANHAVNNFFRKRRSVWLLLAGLSVLGWTVTMLVFQLDRGQLFEKFDEEPFSVFLAAAATALAILTMAEAVQFLWRHFASQAVGTDLIWEVPHIRGASSPFTAHGIRCLVPAEEALEEGCICRSEWKRADPEGDYELLDKDDVPASNYCPNHGIDRINSLSHAAFYDLAEASWLWDEQSPLPYPIDPDTKRTLLFGFAGQPFPGIVLHEKGRTADASFPETEPIEMTDSVLTTKEEYRHQWSEALRPAAGTIDEIALLPAGYSGCAFRYKHGRAWMQPEELDPNNE
jgi:hypothetical protein